MTSVSRKTSAQTTTTKGAQPKTNEPKTTDFSISKFRVGLTRFEALKDDNLYSLFEKYDTNNDGAIDTDEFKKYQTSPKSIPTLTQQILNYQVSKTVSTMDDEEVQATNRIQQRDLKKGKKFVADVNTKCVSITEEQTADENAQAINDNIDADLDEKNEKSLITKLTERYKRKEFTENELEYFKERGIDIDSIDETSAKELAREMIISKYTLNLIDPLLQAVEDQDAEAFAKTAQIIMKTKCNTAELANIIIAMAHRTGKSFSEEQIRSMVNTYAETYQHEDGIDEDLEELAMTDVMSYADLEYIELLYQNNAEMVDRLNEITQNVANNTTDEARRNMLNNIVENSAEIINNGQNKPDSKNNINSTTQNLKNSVTPNAPPVSDPIENAQVNYINELKQQSLEFQNQHMNSSNDVIPENLTHAFSSVREYQTFTGTGMTLFEYQDTKSTLQNNFTSAIKEIVKDYTTMPDVFQNRVRTLFDTLDDNMRGELFVNGDQNIHQFMYKYNYMNDSKLYAFAQRKPAEVSNVSPKIKLMLKEIEAEQVQKA